MRRSALCLAFAVTLAAPALAESWETVTPTTWRFKLRKGVKFHNGNPFTADDVIASLVRVTDDASPLKGNLPAYKSAKKIDDFTVEIEVNGPYPLLLNDLTNIFILDKEWMEANNALQPTDSGKGVKGYATDNANGTGPFIIESRRADSKTVYVANPNWWDKPVHNITRIEFSPVSSASTRVAALLSGEIDFTNVAPLQDLPRLSSSPDVKVLQTNELRTVFFALNLKNALFESDVMLASASGAIILGFNVDIDTAAKRHAESMTVEIRQYTIIYKLLEDVELALKGMLEPVYADRTIGVAEVRQVFRIPRIGTIAGCMVREGEIRRNARARVKRGTQVVADNVTIASLKRPSHRKISARLSRVTPA